MKWISTKERLPENGKWYYVKVDIGINEPEYVQEVGNFLDNNFNVWGFSHKEVAFWLDESDTEDLREAFEAGVHSSLSGNSIDADFEEWIKERVNK